MAGDEPILLGDGLRLRRATGADVEALVAFHAALHADEGMGAPDASVGAWTHDLLSGRHPTCGPGDFTLVEDVRTGAVVSSMCLISQTWTYDGIPFGVGQPELVATHPDYRRRGLIRAQFEVIHRWSAERGEWVQGITGIPNYYRQFGYEMALELEAGRRGFAPHVPALPAGTPEPVHFRPATEADIGFMAEVYRGACSRGPLACLRPEAQWRHDLTGRSQLNVHRREFRMIETPAGERLGFLAHEKRLWKGTLYLTAYELKAGASWLMVHPALMRTLWAAGEACASRDGSGEMQTLAFWLGSEHPAYLAARSRLPRVNKPYAWYLRVPDLQGFVRLIAPALEDRLARSVAAGHSGALRLSFYRDGLRLCFERGRLAQVEPWLPTVEDGGDAFFPGLTFYQLLFGYRSLAELEAAFADCGAEGDDYRVVLDALFPRQPSNVWWIT